MEIGRKEKYAYYEKQLYYRKVTILIILIIITVSLLSSLIIANYTSVFERGIFEKIAKKYGYELSYNNVYEVLASNNKSQGNYIQLTDKENGIYILFRYDEDTTELFRGIDGADEKFYAVTSRKEQYNKLQNEGSILINIDKEFNPKYDTGVDPSRVRIGRGYSITALDMIMGQHRIEFLSNFDIGVNRNRPSTQLYGETVPVSKWFNYENSSSYSLNILKQLVETPTSSDESGTVYFNGGASDVTQYIVSVGDETAGIRAEVIGDTYTEPEPELTARDLNIDNGLDSFIGNMDDNVKHYGNSSYSTFTTIILNESSSGTGILNDTVNLGGKNRHVNGVIIAVCDNNDKSIEKLQYTLSELIVVMYLEKTIIL